MQQGGFLFQQVSQVEINVLLYVSEPVGSKNRLNGTQVLFCFAQIQARFLD